MFEKFNLYDIQKDFIVKAQSVIENDKVGIFSSPTGTGKTLSLLCTLSQYIQPESENDTYIEKENQANDGKYKKSNTFNNIINSNSNNINSSTQSHGMSVENQILSNMLFGIPSHTPTIFYCSRTHSQLNQAIRELKRVLPTCKSVIVGSRRIYCLNNDVKKNGDLEGLNERCNNVVKEGGCEYYNNFDGGLAMGVDLETEFMAGLLNRGSHVNYSDCNRNENSNICDNLNACVKKNTNKLDNKSNKNLDNKLNNIINNIENNTVKLKLDSNKCKNILNIDRKTSSTQIKTITTKKISHTILDIEDITSHCSSTKTCPYFTVKHYSQTCNILFLPYTLLFSKEGRKSANIEIKNSIVVVDEAHNIYETVIQMNTMSVFIGVVERYLGAFVNYKERYEKRMLAVNLEKIKNVILILERLKIFMGQFGGIEDKIFNSSNSGNINKISKNNKVVEISNTNKMSNIKFTGVSVDNEFNAKIDSGFENKKYKQNPVNNKNSAYKTNVINSNKKNVINNIGDKEYQDKFVVIGNNNYTFSDRNNNHGNNTNTNNNPIGQSQDTQAENVMRVSEFLIKSNLLDFNMLEIEDFIKENNITQKLEGFSTNLHSQLFNIAKFLRLLVNSDDNGRIFYTNKRIRFTPLDPKMYFDDIMECKSLILAGGTMEPVDNLKNIFENREVEYHSYPPVCKNFVSFILQEGPSKKEIRLNYESRDNMDTAKEIMACVFNLANAVKKGGIICFIPSKNYIKVFREATKLFKFKKKIMFDDECSFSDYENMISKNETVILFSVLGGRMSEGINFSDDLCRLLIVIGIPYPTLNTELKERIRYNGSNYSTLVAMKVVNQALGRALRHRDDFSGIVLIDSRYKNLISYVVPWIREKIRICNFPTTLVEIAGFLNNR